MNRFRLYILIIVFLVALGGCAASQSDNEQSEAEAPTASSIAPPYIPPSNETPEPTPEEIYVSSGVPEKKLEEIQYECTQISLLYQEIYINAEKEPSPYLGNEDVINQETIDTIEDILIGAVYPVINSDSKCPEYLENDDGVHTFWACVKAGKEE